MLRTLGFPLVLAVACGGTTSLNDAGQGDAGVGSLTTITLAGARTAIILAAAPVANWNVSPNRGELSLQANGANEQTSFAFFFDGAPSVTTYVGNDAGIDCSVFVTLPPPSLDGWLANRGSGIADLGVCTLTLNSVVLAQDVGTQKRYAVHGSVSATLPARSGAASGTVAFSASF